MIDKTLILKELQKFKKIEKNKDFANFLGIKYSTLSMWYNRNSYDIEILLEKFPEINKVWLNGGDAPMIDGKNIYITPTSRNARLKQVLHYLKINKIADNQKDLGVKLGYENGSYFSDIYIDFDLKKIDEANRNIIMILFKKKGGFN